MASRRLLDIGGVILISALVALPCLWHDYIPAGDLPSHLYIAALTSQMESNPVPGLEVHPRTTNALAEGIWSVLLGRLPGRWLDTSVPILAVETFFWGALFWIRRATGSWAWQVTPILGMLTYGVIFHLGFLNFYISAAIALWCIGLLWRPTIRAVVVSTALGMIAWYAHPLPVLWVVFVAAFVGLSRKTAPEHRVWVFVAGVASVILGQILLRTLPSRASWEIEPPLLELLGAWSLDQAWVFGPKYLSVSVLFALAVWIWVWSRRQVLWSSGESFPLWILHGCAYVLLPASIQLPAYRHSAAFLSERISFLGASVLVLWLVQNVSRRELLGVGVPVAALFFSFLYVDGAAYSAKESAIIALVRSAPKEQRIVGPVYDENSRVQPLIHVIDRACVAHCFSFGNYEPATWQFRLRAVAPNDVVAWSMMDVQSIETGNYQVPPSVAPIYSLCTCDASGGLCVLKKLAGERTCSSTLAVSPNWW